MKRLFSFCYVVSCSLLAISNSDLNDQARSAFEQKDFKRAVVVLDQITEQDPGNILAWFNLGQAALMVHQFKTAESAFDRVIEHGGQLKPAASYYRAVIFRKQAKHAQALRELEKLDLESLPPNLVMASVLEYCRASEPALSEFARAIEERSLKDAKSSERDLKGKLNGEAGQFLEGLYWLMRTRNSAARERFSLLRIQAKSKFLVDAAQRLLLILDTGTYADRAEMSGLLQQGIGYDSNIFLNAPGSVQEGFGLLTQVSLERIWHREENYQFFSSLLVAGDFFPKTSSLRSASFDLRTGLTANLDGLTMLIEPRLRHEIANSIPLATSFGWLQQAEILMKDWSFGLGIEGDRILPGVAPFQNWDGYSLAGRAFARFYTGPFQLRFDYGLRRLGIQNDSMGSTNVPTAFIGHAFELGAHYFAGRGFEADVSVTYEYSAFDVVAGSPKDRFDDSIEGEIEILRRFNASFLAFVNLSMSRNISNYTATDIINYNSSAEQIHFGIRWEFLP